LVQIQDSSYSSYKLQLTLG